MTTAPRLANAAFLFVTASLIAMPHGEILPGMLEKRDKAMDVDTAQARQDRADLRALAKPQSGVDDLKGKFARPTKDIPGVVDIKAGTAPR